MEQLIRKQGGSAIITVAPEYLETLGLYIGSKVNITINNGGLFIVPKDKPKKRALKYSLHDLLGDFTGHLGTVDEWDNMPAVGRESPL